MPKREGRWLLVIAIVWLGLVSRGGAEKAEETPAPTRKAAAQQAEFGMVLKATGGGFKNLVGKVTVPADWPDQQRVRVVKEDLPAGAVVSYRNIKDVGRQMAVKFPSLPAGQEVRAVVTFEVEFLPAPALPPDTAAYQCLPLLRQAGRWPSILPPARRSRATTHRSSELPKRPSGRSAGAWEKVEAIHQWIHKNIVYSGEMENMQTCMKTIELRRGVCAEMNSLAVAMLRATRFPARLVRIPGHVYFEVYLLDGEGQGHWIAGDATRDAIVFGRAIEGIILQKGDNVSIIDPNTKQLAKGRILAETITGLPQSRSARLEFQPISPAIKQPASR